MAQTIQQTQTQRLSRGVVQDLLAEFASDPKYREALMRDPKSIIERQFDMNLGSLNVRAVVETEDTAYVVIPHLPGEGELSDRAVEAVAGGKGDPNINASCYNLGGTFNTVNQIAL